jgi:excisionase family DNA binding protein
LGEEMHKFGKKDGMVSVSLVDRFALSPEEASALSGIGLTSIREAIANGMLVAHKHGTRTIILPDDLKAWLKALPKAGNNSVSEKQRVA